EGYDLEIMKDFYIEGTIIPNKGSLTMGGTDGVQGVVSFITPNFYEFNVENPNGVDFLTDANFYGPIHAELGTLEFETGANIVLASDAFDFGDGEEVLTGSISTIKEEADVVGEITMQRYVENFEEGYRIMAVPTLNQTVESAFDGDFLLTGFPGSDFPGQPYTNIKYYNETAAGNVNFGFIDVQSMDEAIDADKAYWGYFPPETSNYVLDASGDFRKGDVTINLSYTDTGDPLNDGWNCIPNPFPSSVDMSSDQIELVNCQRAAYILDHTLGEEWTGEYVSWVDGVANNGGSNILSSYQGFFIQATGPNASITFKEGCKVDDQADFFRYEDQTRQIIRFTLNDEDFGYETTISFHPEGTSNFDSQFDGGFITTTVLDQGIVSLSSQLNGMSYAINTIGELTEPVSITLRATIPEAGEYALKLKDVDNMIESACIVVEDTETGTFTTMEEGTVIPFTTTENAYETERFIVHFYPGATHETQMVSCYNAQDGLVTLNTPAYGDWAVSWTDQNGNLVSSEDQSDSSVISDLASGVYTAVMTSEAGYCNALVQEVAVFEPAQEEVTYFSEMSYCSDETGEVAVAVSNANQWNVAVFTEGEFISEASGNVIVGLNGLDGELYTVQVNSECTSEEFTVDLRDPNEVTAELEAASELELEGVLVPFTAVNLSQNALYTEWYLDGTLVSEAEDLNLEFSEDGAYIITLISSNQQCSDETTHYLLVSSTNSIIEESLSYAILNGDNQITIQFNGLISGGELDVIDAHGKLVYSQVLNSTAEIILNTSDFAEGIYMISLSHDGEQRFTEKFMK
ncbi:MAG: T9SS type A sorting domain-containing protein, partial [Flavobacteriales bacterium]